MSEQQPTTTVNDTSAQGIDRRKFLLRTTAITAGAWAAPSILTIDRAFGAADGSPCDCATHTDAATAKGFVTVAGIGIPVRANACLNDDDTGVGPVTLPGTLGSIEFGDASCGCAATVRVTNVDLLVGGQVITADALQAESSCRCPQQGESGNTGSSQVLNLQVGPVGPVSGGGYQQFTIPFGYVAINETPAESGEPGEYNALHVVFNPPTGDSVDLKFASAKATCPEA